MIVVNNIALNQFFKGSKGGKLQTLHDKRLQYKLQHLAGPKNRVLPELVIYHAFRVQDELTQMPKQREFHEYRDDWESFLS